MRIIDVSGNYDTTQNITTMKKIILLFLTIATITVNGQNHLIGIKGGASWTQIKTNNVFFGGHDEVELELGLRLGLG